MYDGEPSIPPAFGGPPVGSHGPAPTVSHWESKPVPPPAYDPVAAWHAGIPTKPADMVIAATPSVQVADVEDKYVLHFDQPKGAGFSCQVVAAEDRATGERRAVKIIERSSLTGKKADMVAHEKEILRRTRHDNIISLRECLTTPDKVYMVMEEMEMDLFAYLAVRKALPEAEAAVIMQQVLSAVAYLHSICVIHRDIKLENVLVSFDAAGKPVVKLADFGLSKIIESWNVRSTPCGTSFYMAPEIIRGIEALGARPMCTNREEVKSVDIWSCGILLYVLLTGCAPFMGKVRTPEQRRALLARFDRGVMFPSPHWDTISDDAKDLCQKLLAQDPLDRLTAVVALKHPFFANVHADEDPADRAAAPSGLPNGGAAAESSALAEQLADIAGDLRQAAEDAPDATTYQVPEAPARNPVKPKINLGKLPVPAPSGRAPPA